MRSRSICSIRIKLTPSWRVSLIMMILRKFITQEKRVIMKVLRVTQNTRIWRATIVTRRGTLDLSVGFERRNNQMLILLNWLKEIKNNATFYLLQTDQLVTKIDESYILIVHSISVPIERCSLHTLRFKERSLHGEFCYKQGDWQRNNSVLISWWMHHYSSRRSSCSRIKVQSHLS